MASTERGMYAEISLDLNRAKCTCELAGGTKVSLHGSHRYKTSRAVYTNI